ncbi:right-handed parallel beta-helix repeat-containing protein [Streptomyces sp. MA15]|uniref:right-handed parallel beta-helix repeat-containing protein n=1 Tax=Streptomyces sp. MA15 TaxID=3055061 RepID=UPI0025B27D24|nr:right-handed parallel beta-helix repeat-containing protein [Streptomyces sp. MA15]MDN3268112.1 right-handed parallel beta-helix repeat-containing protein [Streptomyces sp. MA15]
MNKRHIACAACITAVVAAGIGAAPSTPQATVHRVQPGQSIQKAVDAARSGDTVLIAAGTYEQSVDITRSGITLRGDAAGRTVLEPPANPGTSACAEAGNGVCVTGTDKKPLKDVSVRSLTVRGFAKNGVWATGTENLKVRSVTAEKNGQWGIAAERSTRSVISHNVTRGNGDAGLFVANTVDTEEGARDAKKTVIRHNETAENRVGVTVRRLRNLSVDHNEATGNCAAVFVVGDESKPRAGHLSVSWNHVHANNKYCAATPRLPHLQGSGIILTGVEETRVAFNRVENNKGASPLSGGIVLFKSLVGMPSERNDVRDNLVTGNSPADLANRDTATTNTFSRNTCTLSEPAGMC